MDRISTLFYKKVNEINNTSTLINCRDLTGLRLKRRCEAFKGFYNDAFRNKYSDIKYLDDIISTQQVIFDSYDEFDFLHNIGLAATLWVLDTLMKCGKMNEAMELLPKNYRDFFDIDLPDDFSHSVYDNDLILATMEVLRDRNGVSDVFFVDEYSAKGTKADNKYRERADALLSLIDSEIIGRACNHFKEKQDELEEHFMNGIIRLYKEYESINNDLLVFQVYDNRTEEQAFRIKRLNDRKDIENRIAVYLLDYGGLTTRPYQELLEEYGIVKVVKQIKGFSVEDPYEICFALLYLLDSGDISPWIYGSGYSIIKNAAGKLPWDIKNTRRSFLKRTDADNCEKWSEYRKNWLEEQISREDQGKLLKRPVFFDTRFNNWTMRQYLYQMTGVVLPCAFHPFEREREELIGEGMPEQDAEFLIEVAEFAFMSKNQVQKKVLYEEELNEDTEARRIEEESIIEDDDTANIGEKLLASAEEIKRLKKEVKYLRNELYKAEKGEQKAVQKYDQAKRIADHEHRELADLRPLIFSQQHQETEKVRRIIDYPYQTKHRIVVVGGYEAFLKRLIPMLPQIRVIRSDEVEDPQVIKNADVVWFQTNYLSHAQYYRIADIARKYNVPVRYLGYTNTEKCAEQIIMDDEKSF